MVTISSNVSTSSTTSKQKTGSKPAPSTGSAGEARIILHLLESGQILPLAERMEFSLGRVSEGQPIMPDIDLTPYKAYDKGVSRLHAVLRRVKNKIVIMDLGSSNGTYVNGNRLSPQIEHVLSHGDTIHLGKLKIQILFSPDEK
ncbi:MAG: FHA domain-containing protein [Anaerolineales bacterium]|nr:FHA domain-containing protein [Anaerolineales bacterium]